MNAILLTNGHKLIKNKNGFTLICAETGKKMFVPAEIAVKYRQMYCLNCHALVKKGVY